MKMVHKEKGFTIEVEGRRNKPVVTKQGFVVIANGQYKRCNMICAELLEEKFEVLEEA